MSSCWLANKSVCRLPDRPDSQLVDGRQLLAAQVAQAKPSNQAKEEEEEENSKAAFVFCCRQIHLVVFCASQWIGPVAPAAK